MIDEARFRADPFGYACQTLNRTARAPAADLRKKFAIERLRCTRLRRGAITCSSCSNVLFGWRWSMPQCFTASGRSGRYRSTANHPRRRLGRWRKRLCTPVRPSCKRRSAERRPAPRRSARIAPPNASPRAPGSPRCSTRAVWSNPRRSNADERRIGRIGRPSPMATAGSPLRLSPCRCRTRDDWARFRG